MAFQGIPLNENPAFGTNPGVSGETQEKNDIFAKKTTKRRILGYLTRPIRELVNGGDTGYTLVKAGIILGLGAAAVTTLLPAVFIIVGGGLFAFFYVGIYLKDEYDRNKEEDTKLQELEAFKKSDLDSEISRQIVELNPQNHDEKVNLLNYLSRHYLKHLGINLEKPVVNGNIKKPDGSLPGQEAMIDLMAKVMGINKAEFGNQISDFLTGNDPEFATLVTILGLNNGSTDTPRQRESKNFARKLAEHFEKFLFFFHKGNTAMGLVVGGSILFGAITIGAIVSWPIIVGGVAFALVSAVVALVYDYYVAKSYSDSMETMNKELKTKRIRYELLNKLEKINRWKNPNSDLTNVSSGSLTENLTEIEGRESEITELAVGSSVSSSASDLVNSSGSDSDAKSPLLKNTNVKSFVSPVLRIYANMIAKIVYSASIGVVVGLAIAWIALVVAGVVLLPLAPLALTLAGAIVGGVYGLFYGYAFGKGAIEAGQIEMQRIEEVKKLREECDETLGNEQIVEYLKNEKPELVKLLIVSYLNYLNAQSSKFLPKLVKIVGLIAGATGIKYDGNLDIFFDRLEKELPNESKVGELREKILGIKSRGEVSSNVATEKPSLIQRLRDTLNSSDARRDTKHFILTYALPTLGALSVVFPLSFMMFGVGALLALGFVSVIVMASFTANKVFEHYSEKNMKQLDDDEAKLRLIKQIFKLREPEKPSKYFNKLPILSQDGASSRYDCVSFPAALRKRNPQNYIKDIPVASGVPMSVQQNC
jgi:hypothetical protein